MLMFSDKGRLLERRRVAGYTAMPRLYNEQTFYTAFERSLAVSQKEILIESPFITRKRLLFLLPQLRSAVDRGVSVIINTRDPRLNLLGSVKYISACSSITD